jgi:hypothetical protein
LRLGRDITVSGSVSAKIENLQFHRRVPPGECGLASSDGDPGTNGVITKLAAEYAIKSDCALLQAAEFVFEPTRPQAGLTWPMGSPASCIHLALYDFVR